MCIICVSKSGVRQPGEVTIRAMFLNNPHGAGYMVARGGRVEIHKGFMRLDEYLRAIRAECFTPQDSVVYHFRISTQAGVGPEMTHPFPLSTRPERMRQLDLSCRVGVAFDVVGENQRAVDFKELAVVKYFPRSDGQLGKALRKLGDFVRV